MTDWMQTATGRKFYVDAPQFFVEDFSSALSKVCRYAGHCRRFYSVAEHSVLLAQYALKDRLIEDQAQREQNAWELLLHDVSEAYLVDIPRPIKKKLPDYARLEESLQRAVAIRFGLTWPHTEYVNLLDYSICLDEKEQNMAPGLDWEMAPRYRPLNVALQFWSPDEAERQFRNWYDILQPEEIKRVA